MLTSFDFAVIEYAAARCESSAFVYDRISKMEPIGYRDVLGEKVLIEKLDRLKQKENR